MATPFRRDSWFFRPGRRSWLLFCGALWFLARPAGAHASPGPGLGVGSQCERALERCALHLDMVWRGRVHGLLVRYHMRDHDRDSRASGARALDAGSESAAVALWYSARLFGVTRNGLAMSAHSLMGLGQELQLMRTGRWPREPGVHGGVELELSGTGAWAGLALIIGVSARAEPAAGWAGLLRAPGPATARRWRLDYGPSLSVRVAPWAFFRGRSR